MCFLCILVRFFFFLCTFCEAFWCIFFLLISIQDMCVSGAFLIHSGAFLMHSRVFLIHSAVFFYFFPPVFFLHLNLGHAHSSAVLMGFWCVSVHLLCVLLHFWYIFFSSHFRTWMHSSAFLMGFWCISVHSLCYFIPFFYAFCCVFFFPSPFNLYLNSGHVSRRGAFVGGASPSYSSPRASPCCRLSILVHFFMRFSAFLMHSGVFLIRF